MTITEGNRKTKTKIKGGGDKKPKGTAVFSHPLAVGLTRRSAGFNGGFREGRWQSHQRGGAGGSFLVGAVFVVGFVVLVGGALSLRLRFSSATSNVMTSTQPMAWKSAKFRNGP